MILSKADASDLARVLSKLECQFLSCFPVSKINWNEIPSDITWSQQKELIDCTYKHPLNMVQPVRRSYALSFLKKLLKYLGSHGDIHDLVYECYCEAQLSNPNEDATFAYKHYKLPMKGATFSMRESKSFVAMGTTGLCSWQASLALADYLLHHPEIVQDKAVLELGSGTGLFGFIIFRCCEPRQLILTDGSKECVDLMRENLPMNFPTAQEIDKHVFLVGHQQLELREMCWDEVEDIGPMLKIMPDVVVASDVIYDATVFDDLIRAMDFIFTSMENRTTMLLSATVRNEDTLNHFLCLLDRYKFRADLVEASPTKEGCLQWDRSTPIKIFVITRI